MSTQPPDWQRYVPTLTEVVDPSAGTDTTRQALSGDMAQQVEAIVSQVLDRHQQALDHRLKAEFQRLGERLAERMWNEMRKQLQSELQKDLRAALADVLSGHARRTDERP